MVHVAKEMERKGMNLPLLIGGATTSEIHTAVKIAPNYSAPVIHVRDASKSVNVSASLISEERKKDYAAGVKAKYQNMKAEHDSKKKTNMYITYQEAIKNKLNIQWSENDIVKPTFLGNQFFYSYPLEEIRKYIDWTFFFHAWKLNGKYPAIFDDPVKGEEAKKLFDDANQLLDQIVDKKMLEANGVIGFYPVNSIGEETWITAPPARVSPRRRQSTSWWPRMSPSRSAIRSRNSSTSFTKRTARFPRCPTSSTRPIGRRRRCRGSNRTAPSG